ncbi:hypothetical protein PR202_gb13633 [Eleusine coracana subsp. coracana]|uniref:Disease resistance R13L4/SHOC-2-like LRR domain-containing protein n=1 Tax=Eleusine coracana subsp. coracana TaxID=191504 RepID=A0AAV5ETP2_ELECO|nr:hypothetical protein PR202_gb13633 [Eleusine coracana subsp. coracana]
MKQLEILSSVEVQNSGKDLMDIGELLQLRKLGVILNGENSGLSIIFQQIDKLHACLRSLSIRINQPAKSENPVVAHLVTPPKLLQSLSISGITGGLPLWIAELDQLANITLRDTFLGEDAINILGKLRKLCSLKLLHKSYNGHSLNFKAQRFQRLRFLIVEGNDITNISFDDGAAPRSEMLVWSFRTLEALTGVHYLPKLKKLELNGDCGDHNLYLVRAAIKDHPNNPVLKHNPYHQSQEADGNAAAASSSSVP